MKRTTNFEKHGEKLTEKSFAEKGWNKISAWELEKPGLHTRQTVSVIFPLEYKAG